MNKRYATAIFAMVAAAMLPAFSATAATPNDGPQPNIVYILADDLGWKDVGFHGSDILTPNIDRLAATGARLEQFYAEPMCTPTRAALMTGRYPVRYGLQTAVIPSAGKYGLATDEWLLPQALREAGYETAIVGKWHLGHAKREYWPRGRGFDHQYGAMLGEIDYFTKEAHGTRDWFRDEQVARDEGYVTTLLGDEAVKRIVDRAPKKPLFLYLAFTAPHAPYQAPKEYLDKYGSIEDPARRAYAAMITAMDDQIGRVIETLQKQEMLDNTLIIFHSDNGGPRSAKLTGEVDTSGGSIPPDNGPYRDGKGSVYEGGTRVAALASWPGRIKSGTSIDQPIHVVDMYPTLASLAAASVAKQKPLDGVDVWPTISEGKPSPRREIVYNIEPTVAGIREGEWKLVWTTTLPTRVELFDLRSDPFEKNNVADQHPEKVAELKNRAEQLAREGVPPLVMGEITAAAFGALTASVALPEDEQR